MGTFGEPGFKLGKAPDVLPVPPTPVPLLDVEGVKDSHADISPFSQFEVVESCCCELPLGLWGDDCACALGVVKNRATEKTINTRKHLLMLVLMFVVFRLKIRVPHIPHQHARRSAARFVLWFGFAPGGNPSAVHQ